MKTFVSLVLSLSALATGAALAQSPATTGETSLVLDIGNGFRPVAASRVTVPVGEILRITGPSYGGRPIQWIKNNQPLPGAISNPLVISSVRASDAGTYRLVNNEPNVSSIPSQLLVLSVGPSERFVNLSTRAWVGGADQTFVAGFVVTAGDPTASKKIILRAVGPTLTQFGVPGVLRQPVLTIYDSAGRPYTNAYVYPTVTGALTYETDLADSLARCGAFPIPAGTKDVTVLRPFPPGNYTAHVTSADGTSGNVLLEIYEIP